MSEHEETFDRMWNAEHGDLGAGEETMDRRLRRKCFRYFMAGVCYGRRKQGEGGEVEALEPATLTKDRGSVAETQWKERLNDAERLRREAQSHLVRVCQLKAELEATLEKFKRKVERAPVDGLAGRVVAKLAAKCPKCGTPHAWFVISDEAMEA